MRNTLRRCLRATLLAALLFQLVGCGTILYPERSGQGRGRLDSTVLILDGIGLFFFLVPGVIAFAVDFATGAIYLPQGATSDVDEILSSTQIRQYRGARGELGEILAFVEARTGLEIDPHSLQVARGDTNEPVEMRLRELNARIAEARSRGLPAGG